MEFLQLTGIGKTENGSAVISGIDLVMKKHQRIAIAGETGSGKSTLLKIIGGFAQPDTGTVRFEGERVEGPAEKLIPGHPGVAYLSQQYELPNNMWVHEVLEYADELPPGEAQLLYQTCRIDHLVKRRTNQLSGGEKQRIALARLLTRTPKLLLLDEPFSNLDPIHKNILKQVIADIGEKLGTTCMLASHDPVDTLSWADEIIVIRSGKIVQQGTPSVLYTQPVNEYVAGLFGSYNLVPAALTASFIQGDAARNNKDIFFRPEEIRLNEPGATVEAIVERIAFMGAYYEIGLLSHGIRLLARVMKHELHQGERVGISVNEKACWWW
jgi:ABC-type sugar transport system ATPase subunit